ncbi:hypothetical protein KL86DES1_21743 [uncultured Desulfovibrio sp.]|uniref:Uncharacterized protein n=1 Tax=uncultured Desulfovibrio sp. TaxID=167968 RepID=A0A212L9W2_9BACT|nr:hypothetical protein KL86DES1_21743 [uncultured Desulfovibrio sp.]VZH34647.1 conserved protein of unknown function [Desulfovibrio sp. 86]
MAAGAAPAPTAFQTTLVPLEHGSFYSALIILWRFRERTPAVVNVHSRNRQSNIKVKLL